MTRTRPREAVPAVTASRTRRRSPAISRSPSVSRESVGNRETTRKTGRSAAPDRPRAIGAAAARRIPLKRAAPTSTGRATQRRRCHLMRSMSHAPGWKNSTAATPIRAAACTVFWEPFIWGQSAVVIEGQSAMGSPGHLARHDTALFVKMVLYMVRPVQNRIYRLSTTKVRAPNSERIERIADARPQREIPRSCGLDL